MRTSGEADIPRHYLRDHHGPICSNTSAFIRLRGPARLYKLIVLATLCLISVNYSRADDVTVTDMTDDVTLTDMNATSSPTTNTFFWQQVPTKFRTGVRLTINGKPLHTVNLSAYADNVNWSCTSNCTMTSAHGNGQVAANDHWRAQRAYQFGIFLYQLTPTGGSPPGTVPVPDSICNISDSAVSPANCVFSANGDIYVNVNDVASFTNDFGPFVPDNPVSRNNYAYDDNVGSYDLHIMATPQ